MKVTDLNCLYVGYNESEDFRVLICAADEQDAQKAANGYCSDLQMCGNFVISKFSDIDTQFDCDYVLMAED